MSIRVCRLIEDFPSLEDMRKKDGEKTNYVEYGLAPGIYSIMENQVAMGAHMHVIAISTNHVSRDEAVDGIEVHRVGRPYSLTALAKIRQLDKEVGIKVVHAHATSAPSYPLLRHFMRKKPYVVHVHGTTAGVLNDLKASPYSEPGNSMKRSFRVWLSLKRQGFVWKRADRLLAVSSNIASELQKFYDVPSDKIRVVFNGVDANIFKSVDDEQAKRDLRIKLGIQGEPVILYIGHLSPRKGIHGLLKAAPKVIDRFPKAVFVLVGGTARFIGNVNYQKVWVDMAADLGISKNILFVGQVKHRATPDYYAVADVFAFPTLYEGLAKALLEAMACRLPVVTTNVGGNPDAVVNEETGILTEPSNSEKFGDALINVLSDPNMAKEMGRKGRERVEKHFTWEIAADKVMKIYKELL